LSNSLERKQPRVLLVDDDRLFVEIVQDMLHKEGVQTGVAFGGEEALELFEEGGWDVVVTDVVMDHMSGIDLLREIRKRDRLVPVICISSVKSFDAVVEMLRSGAHNFIYKPLEPERFLSAIRKAHRDHLQAVENEVIIQRSETWAKELLALRQLGESSSRDMLQVLFRKTVEAVADTLQIETVSLMILEDEHLVVKEGIGLPKEVIGKARVPLGSGISGYVAQTGEPVLINDISKHDRFKPSKFKKQYSTQSALCVPLLRGERVLGVINANNKTSGASFFKSDLDLLVTIAAQVAMAADNAGLYRGLEEKAEALAEAHEELLRLDKDKTELILNISHELKTPLTSIIGFSGLIHNLDVWDKDENLTMYVDRIESSANLLNHLVERMLELFRLEARRSKMTREHMLSTEIVSLALADLEGILNGREVERDNTVIEDKMIYCDPFLFTRALGVVLENAVKFSPEDTPLKIAGQWHDSLPDLPEYASYVGLGDTDGSSNGWVELIVSDQGEGMKEQQIPLIFDKFRQLGDIMTTKPSGIGLGLSIARVILEQHDGTIWAESELGKGSHLHILFPGKKEDSHG